MKKIRLFAPLRAAYGNRTEPENLRVIAESSWRALVVLAFGIAVLACAFGWWEFESVSDGIAAAQQAAPSSAGATLQRGQLDAVSDQLQARASAFQSLSVNPSAPVSDPYDD